MVVRGTGRGNLRGPTKDWTSYLDAETDGRRVSRILMLKVGDEECTFESRVRDLRLR